MAFAACSIRAHGCAPKAGLTLRLAVALSVATVLALSASAVARADGDPASDVLYTQWVFLPFESPVPKEESNRLQQVVQSARSAGYPIKVAIIDQPADLGTAYALWKKPQQYARFLGQELVFLYKGPLLIVMPNRYGIFNYKHSVAAERAILDKLRVRNGPDGHVESAVTAVAQLAAAAGHPVPVPPPAKLSGESSGGSQTIDRLIIVAAAAAFAILIVAAPVVHRWRARAAR